MHAVITGHTARRDFRPRSCPNAAADAPPHGMIGSTTDTGAYALLHAGVPDRPAEARSLPADGLRLLFVEGYRPPALQRKYYEECAAEQRALHPTGSPTTSARAAGLVGYPTEACHWSYGDRYQP
ncbi:hypothetical protein ACFU6M_32195 [Streptomyces bottropensis]|uniref:hypothetical protein n=1 Tax=Streptomyces bottropensis TaxID=42235 RepID=UPI0036924AE4